MEQERDDPDAAFQTLHERLKETRDKGDVFGPGSLRHALSFVYDEKDDITEDSRRGESRGEEQKVPPDVASTGGR